MKTIPTQDVCLSCYSKKLSPAVNKLPLYYPKNRVTGFKLGVIRDTFSFTGDIN
jgi:hypothetical protein